MGKGTDWKEQAGLHSQQNRKTECRSGMRGNGTITRSTKIPPAEVGSSPSAAARKEKERQTEGQDKLM